MNEESTTELPLTPRTMCRNGKIARLPHAVRLELNQRLRDGESGKGLVEWLNGLPEVKAALQREFGGRAIREQNVSEWKQGGFRPSPTPAEAPALAGEADSGDDAHRPENPAQSD